MSQDFTPIRFSVPGRDAAVDRNRKLGRGLNALLNDTRREERLTAEPDVGQQDASDPASADALRAIPVGAIKPLPGQPRTHFDQEALEQLAASIAARGLIQPILVQPQTDGTYTLIAGERRWRAAQIAKLETIPAIVRELEQREVMALALIENLQREDLNPLEEARAYQRLADEEGLTQAEIATMVDKSRSHVANLQRLLQLPDSVQALVAENRLSMGHARALIGHDNAEALAMRAVEQGLSVRDVENATRSRPARQRSAGKSPGAQNADLAAVETHLQEFLGMAIQIKAEADARKGSVTIHYRTLDQLDLICQRLTGGDL